MFEGDPQPAETFGDSARQLLHRRELAATRHREAVARLLMVNDREMLAIGHLAQRGALSPATLGSLLNLSSAGVTALVQRMEAVGRFVREANPADGRSVLVRLSPEFAERAERAFEPLVTELQQVAEEIPVEHRAPVARFLSRVALATEQHADQVMQGLDAQGRRGAALPSPGLWG